MNSFNPSKNSIPLPDRQAGNPPKHIVFINYYFPPMGGGGVQRVIKFLKYFNYEKYDVSVLTVKPSFFYTMDESLLKEIPQLVNVLRSGSLDPFRLLHFYKLLKNKISKKSTKDNIYTESANRIRRISMSFFVPDSRILWLPFALVKLWQLNRIKPIDLLFASMPPFTSGLIGVLFQRWMNVPAILDFRDAWTNNPYLPKINPLIAGLNEKLEKYCVEKARGIIFVNPNLQEYYKGKYSEITSKPYATIRNGFDPEDFEFLRRSDPKNAHDRFTLGIMGTIYSQGNRPITLLKAIKELLVEDPATGSKIKLAFLGKWSSDFLNILREFNLNHTVELIPYMEHREALQRAADFDALSLSIESGLPGSELVTPGRIYEYLRLHMPILALCPLNSDLAYLTNKYKAGEIIEFNDVPKIKSVLRNWVCHSASFAKKYKSTDLQELSRPQLTDSLLTFLQKF